MRLCVCTDVSDVSDTPQIVRQVLDSSSTSECSGLYHTHVTCIWHQPRRCMRTFCVDVAPDTKTRRHMSRGCGTCYEDAHAPVTWMSLSLHGMGSDLVDGGFDDALPKQSLQLLRVEVGDADGLDDSAMIQRLELAPCIHEVYSIVRIKQSIFICKGQQNY